MMPWRIASISFPAYWLHQGTTPWKAIWQCGAQKQDGTAASFLEHSFWTCDMKYEGILAVQAFQALYSMVSNSIRDVKDVTFL